MDDCLKARAEDIPVTFKDYTRSELRISYHSWYNPNVSPHVFQFLTVEVIVFIQLNVINAMLSRFSRVRLCATDPLDSSPPGSSVHGIFQARVMEWGAIDTASNLCMKPQFRSTSNILNKKWAKY